MLKINAASRLLVTAEGEWFHSLPEEMQKQYIEEHPDSKYAKGYRPKGDQPSIPRQNTAPNDPQSHQNQPGVQTPMGAPQRLQRPPAQLVKPRPQLPKKTEEALKHVPKPVGRALKNGGMKPKSKERVEIAEKLKAHTPRLARGMIKDTMGAAKGLASTYNIVVKGKPEKGDFKKVASMFGTILGSSVMAAAIGTTGPVGFLAFMAVKHMAAPALYRLAQSAFHPPPEPDSYGYWEDEDTWVDIPKKQWEQMTDDDVDKIQKQKAQEKLKQRQAEGKWKHGEWNPKPRERKHASVVTATDEEKQMTVLLNKLLEFVASGDIPKEAMEKAVYQMADSQIRTDREHEKEQQLQRQEQQNESD